MARKRGRKRKVEEVTTVDVDVREEMTPKNSQKSFNFKCSECCNGFETEAEANRHVLQEHYGLARINDDSKTPFTDKEVLQTLIKAQKKLKVLKCKNEGCLKSFKSGLGLKMHWEGCGKSEAELCVICDVCGKQLKKSSISYHMTTHSTGLKNENNAKEDKSEAMSASDQKVSTGRNKKRAAQKTIRKSTKGETNETDDSVSDEEFKFNPAEEEEDDEQTIDDTVEEANELQTPKQNIEQHFKNLISLWSEFIASNDISFRELPQTVDQWFKEVRKKGRIRCPLKECSQSFTTVYGLKYHYKRCGIDIKYVWKCKLCGFEAVKGNRIIIQHLWTEHKESMPKISQELVEIIETANTTTLTNSATDNRRKRRKQTLKTVEDFYKKFYSQKTFLNLKPIRDCWKKLSENEYNIYVCDSKQSIHFKSSRDKNLWKKLNLFDSSSTEPHNNFYVGGPVWAVDWCPLPLDVDQQCDQFVAIASNMNQDITHSLSDTDNETGLIQLWNVGKLNSQFDASIKPKLVLAIAHSCGMVWDMKWCPGGTTYEPMTSESNSDSLPRLGLLAIACGNGFVHIHSILHPKSLTQSNNPNDYPLYYNEPVVVLNPPGVGPSTSYEQTICKCVSWIHSDNQQLIAAGYGSGLIAVWDLSTKSSLLIVQRNPKQLILKPMISWFGHNAVINRIKWFQSSGRFLATCSFDRSAKLWNLSDTAAPVSVFKKGLFTALDTHPQWNGMFLSHDDCYFGFQTPVYFKDFGYNNFGAVSLLSHKSCVWDLSVSQWTSALVSVDAAGEAVVYPNFKFVAEPKRNTYDKIPLFHINYVPLDQKQSSKPKKKVKKSDSLVDIHSKPPIRAYPELYEKYGIVFNDYDLREEKVIPMEEINRIRLSAQMQYQRLNDFPLVSINRVCWNPNQWSHWWVVSATQSGLCRLSCLPLLAHKSPTDANYNCM